ncbi:MAG: hypothetical protein MJ107_08140 [Lachnospiraceae bacterium]|nr:hypothetical protein [Lachnospiraceae bacterium]
MNKKAIAIILIVLIAILLGVILTMFFRKKNNNVQESNHIEVSGDMPITQINDLSSPFSGDRDDPQIGQNPENSDSNAVSKAVGLFCLTASEEEARELAEAYGITFINWQYKVATFETKEGQNPYDIIRYGRDNGLTELEIDHEVHAY